MNDQNVTPVSAAAAAPAPLNWAKIEARTKGRVSFKDGELGLRALTPVFLQEQGLDLDEILRQAANATKVEMWNCPTALTLSFAQATAVKVWNCDNLTTLEAPQATTVDLWECPKLMVLNSPLATQVSVWFCPTMETLPDALQQRIRAGECSFYGEKRLCPSTANPGGTGPRSA